MRRRATAGLAAWLVLAAGLGASGCRQEGGPAELPPSPVAVATVEARDLTVRIEATGELVAKSHASIAAQAGGEITAVPVEEGDAVEAGQVLLEIDPERHQLERDRMDAMLSEAQAQLREQERDTARIRRLFERDAASQARIDEAEMQLALARSRVDSARAQLGLARRTLADSQVRAPFSGRVARRHVSLGEFVGVGQALMDLVELHPIEVEFHLPEIDSGRVSLGDGVAVRVAPYPDEVFEAEVTVIAPTIDPATRTLRVKGEIPNAEGRLRPGLFARAELGVEQRRGVPMVPQEAVLERADGQIVFRLDEDHRVRRLRVVTGVHRGESVEVREGLRPGEQVVVRGHARLIDGAVVSVRNPDGSPVARAEGSAATATP